MEEEVKVSELPIATDVNDDDLIMIVQDGYNKQVQKSILLKDLYPTAWTNAILASGISGIVKYIRVGTLAIVEIRELYSLSDITTSGTIIASGLPKALVGTNFVVSLVTASTSNDPNCRLRIDNTGNLTLYYDKMYAGSSSLQYYGQVMYLTNE